MKREHRLRYIIKEGLLDTFYIWKDELRNVFKDAGGMIFFFFTMDAAPSRYKTIKISHWLVQPELRYWTCDVFNGWFFGLHALGGQINIGGDDVPFVLQKADGNVKDHSKEG